MTDVFFCSADRSPKRAVMAAQCANRWSDVDDIRFIQLNPWRLDKTLLEFQRYRRVIADRLAESDIYVLCDDDMLVSENFNLSECVQILKDSDFSMISLMPSNCEIYPWTPDNGYEVQRTSDVLEHHSVGGVRFCKKPLLREWPQM